MKKFIIFSLVIVVAFIAVILVIASTKPGAYKVTGSITVNAKPEKVFSVINEMNNWTKWSPWESMDPEMKRSFTGAAKGVGAVYEWDGKKVGKGRITIVESVPSVKVVMKNEWISPMQMYNMNEYALSASGNTTVVTWTMTGPASFTQKIFSVFMDMNKAMKPAFDAGLARLKVLSEK